MRSDYAGVLVNLPELASPWLKTSVVVTGREGERYGARREECEPPIRLRVLLAAATMMASNSAQSMVPLWLVSARRTALASTTKLVCTPGRSNMSTSSLVLNSPLPSLSAFDWVAWF